MSAIITYNGVNPFGTRTPIVEISTVLDDSNGYISETDRYTLRGSRPRPNCNSGWSEYKADIDAFLEYFKLQFKTFSIIENGNVIFTFPQSIIRSVSFPETAFKGYYEYEIVIDCIKSFENSGVVDPQETYETSQDDSPVTTVRHTISCRGIGPNGVDAARSFIEQRRVGLMPFEVTGNPDSSIVLTRISRAYSVNRLTGEVSVTSVYIYNEEDLSPQYSSAVLTYTLELSETIDGTTISIQGNIQGNAVDGDDEMQQAKFRFDQTDWQAIAQREWINWGGTTFLGDHITFSVNENPLTAQVDFSITWDSNSQESPYLQENWTITQSNEGNPTCFRYQGVVKSDRGCAGQKFAELESFFNSINFQNRISILWTKYGTGETLSLTPRSQSLTKNRFSPSITFEIQYCHDPGQICGCAENMTYNMSFVDSIEQYTAQPVLRGMGRYVVQDLGFKNRKKFTIQGTARTSKCCTVEQAKFSIKNRLNFLCAQYFPGTSKILDDAQIENSETGDELNFNYSWSAAAD